MKRTYKIMSILLTVFMLATVFTNVYALTPSAIGEASKNAGTDTTEISELGGKILSVISTVGIVLSVLMLSILGIKYMLGSSEEKAEYKKSLMPYIVGCVFVFGASTIANMVYNFMQ